MICQSPLPLAIIPAWNDYSNQANNWVTEPYSDACDYLERTVLSVSMYDSVRRLGLEKVALVSIHLRKDIQTKLPECLCPN